MRAYTCHTALRSFDAIGELPHCRCLVVSDGGGKFGHPMGTNLADGYGFDQSIEEILGGIIDRKRRLNRLVELKSKVMVDAEEHEEIQFLERRSGDTSTIWRDRKRKKE